MGTTFSQMKLKFQRQKAICWNWSTIKSYNRFTRTNSGASPNHGLRQMVYTKQKQTLSSHLQGVYEPYMVGPRTMPRFDERFAGYGMDKVELNYELHLAKYMLLVAPNAFVSPS